MGLGDKNFLIYSVFFTVIIALGFMQMGTDLNDNRDLDAQSQVYLTNFANQSNANGIGELDTATKNLDKESNPMLDKVGDIPFVSDMLGAINWVKEKTVFLWTFGSMVFNVPTFLISSLGISAGAFSIYLNVLGAVLFIGLLLFLTGVIK